MEYTKEVVESIVKEKETVESLVKELDGKISTYESLGTPEQITKIFDQFEEMISRLQTLGSLDEIEEALTKAQELIESYKELGTPEEIGEALESSKTFFSNQEAGKLSQEYKISVDIVKDMMETYESPEKVREVLGKLLTKRSTEKDEDVPTTPANKSGVPTRRINKLASGL